MKTFLKTVVVLAIQGMLVSSAFAQFFTIEKFHSDITIQPDSSFTVTERIDVNFSKPRHGIYREIPFKYRDDLGHTIKTPTHVLSVTDGSGKKWKAKVSKEGNVVNIRIGDANKYVQGRQVYTITYRVENAILFLSDHDELYWNITGNDWKAPIEEASAHVTLAVPAQSKNLWAAAYTGPFGSKESAADYETHTNEVTFSSKRPLHIGEGLTIAFGWDKGLMTIPSAWKKFLWAIDMAENWVFLFPPLALAFMFFLWRRRGRDPRVRESMTVMYEPPKFEGRPLTPAEVGTLIDENFDPRDITSTLVGLGVKGYLRIEEKKREGLLFDSTDYYLKKMKDSDAQLSPFEKELMESLFPGQLPGVYVSNLKNRFYTNLGTLKDILYGELIRKKYFLMNPEKVRGTYAMAGVVIMVFGAFAFAFLVPGSIGKGVLASILTGLPVFVFAKFMPAKTKAGASVYMDILGFREFMTRAEKDRLERMGDSHLFSKFLPYAMALDVTDNWAKAFEGIYQQPPEWYVSPVGIRTFDPFTFSHSIQSVTSNLSSAMFSAPRGSGGSGGGGSGGGGSSGGGFGGGGGGSW
jgi:uncharacterized membrane protein YgcG